MHSRLINRVCARDRNRRFVMTRGWRTRYRMVNEDSNDHDLASASSSESSSGASTPIRLVAMPRSRARRGRVGP